VAFCPRRYTVTIRLENFGGASRIRTADLWIMIPRITVFVDVD
jgi:hypothetical protein